MIFVFFLFVCLSLMKICKSFEIEYLTIFPFATLLCFRVGPVTFRYRSDGLKVLGYVFIETGTLCKARIFANAAITLFRARSPLPENNFFLDFGFFLSNNHQRIVPRQNPKYPLVSRKRFREESTSRLRDRP